MLNTQQDGISPASVVERRRAMRVKLQFPIEVSGWEQKGISYKDITKTNDVSKCGCSFTLARELLKGDFISVRTGLGQNGMDGKDSMICEVVRVAHIRSGYTIGVRNREDDCIWPMVFPGRS
jgi:hypothetical protein